MVSPLQDLQAGLDRISSIGTSLEPWCEQAETLLNLLKKTDVSDEITGSFSEVIADAKKGLGDLKAPDALYRLNALKAGISSIHDAIVDQVQLPSGTKTIVVSEESVETGKPTNTSVVINMDEIRNKTGLSNETKRSVLISFADESPLRTAVIFAGKLRGYLKYVNPATSDSSGTTSSPTPPPAKVAAANDGVLKLLTELIAQKGVYDVSDINPADDLVADLGIDAIDLAEIVAKLREGQNLPRDDSFRFSNYRTVQSLAGYFSGRVAQTAPAVGGHPITETVTLPSGSRVSPTFNPNYYQPTFVAGVNTLDLPVGLTGLPGITHGAERAEAMRRFFEANNPNTTYESVIYKFIGARFDGGVVTFKQRSNTAGTQVEMKSGNEEVGTAHFRNTRDVRPIPDLTVSLNDIKPTHACHCVGSCVIAGKNPQGLGLSYYYDANNHVLVSALPAHADANARMVYVLGHADDAGWLAGFWKTGQVGKTSRVELRIVDRNLLDTGHLMAVTSAGELSTDGIPSSTTRTHIVDIKTGRTAAYVEVPFVPVAGEYAMGILKGLGVQTNHDISHHPEMAAANLRTYLAAMGPEKFAKIVRGSEIPVNSLPSDVKSALQPHLQSRGTTLGFVAGALQPVYEDFASAHPHPLSELKNRFAAHHQEVGRWSEHISHGISGAARGSLGMAAFEMYKGETVNWTEIAASMAIMGLVGFGAGMLVAPVGFIGFTLNSLITVTAMEAMHGNFSLYDPKKMMATLTSIGAGGAVEGIVMKGLLGGGAAQLPFLKLLALSPSLAKMVYRTAAGTFGSFSGFWSGDLVQREANHFLGVSSYEGVA